MGSLGTGRQYLPDHGMTQPFGATQPILHILIVGPHQPPAICHTLTRDCQLSATSRWVADRGKQTPRPAEHGSDPRKPLLILHHTPLTPAIGIYKCQAVVYRVLPPLSPYMGIAGRIAGVGSTAHLVSGPHNTNTAAGSDTARTGYCFPATGGGDVNVTKQAAESWDVTLSRVTPRSLFVSHANKT